METTFSMFTYQKPIHFSHVIDGTKERLPGHILSTATGARWRVSSDVIGKLVDVI